MSRVPTKRLLRAYRFHYPDGPSIILGYDAGEAEKEFYLMMEEFDPGQQWNKIELLGEIENNDPKKIIE